MPTPPRPPQPLDSAVAAEAAIARLATRARVALPPGATSDVAAWLRAEVELLSAALGGVRAGPEGAAVGVGAGGMPLRADQGPAQAMSRPARLLAPSSRLGYVLVPRLAGEPVRSGAGPTLDPRADDAFAAELESGA